MAAEYLDHLLKSNIFNIPIGYIKLARLKDLTYKKIEIYHLFENAIKTYAPNVLSGFDDNHMPDKVWLVNVYFFLNAGRGSNFQITKKCQRGKIDRLHNRRVILMIILIKK